MKYGAEERKTEPGRPPVGRILYLSLGFVHSRNLFSRPERGLIAQAQKAEIYYDYAPVSIIYSGMSTPGISSECSVRFSNKFFLR